jgi:hypothetical protein
MHLEKKTKKSIKIEQELDIIMQTAVKCDIVKMTRDPIKRSINEDSTARIDDIW